MPVDVELNTPLAEALNAAIQPKLVEVGWGTGGGDESALAEYIILMLVNGKTQEQIAAELSGDLLSLPPDDPGVHKFSKWLFEQIDAFSQTAHGGQDSNNQEAAASSEMDTDMGGNDAPEFSAPTGPRSMRNGDRGGARGNRMIRHISKAMDRTGDSVLHRTRGNERINTHGRGLASGARGGVGRGARHQQHNRAANIQHGLAAGMASNPAFGGMPGQPGQMDVFAILEQQNQMMFQLSQQIMTQQQSGPQRGRGGKSLFSRSQDPNNRNHHDRRQKGDGPSQEAGNQGEDVDMSGGKREAPNPDETVCKWNLGCTNSDCKFAHQSPAAPPGAPVDVNDPCSFGAACKNRKCVARHPSPATKTAHQGEQDCKFFPNCQNPRCPFKHPSMPLCRNGADCTTTGCKFTHVSTKCKFNPCLNPKCRFAHEEGQQGGFKDKVWTAETTQEHVSDRKFVDDDAAAELVKPEEDADIMRQEEEDVA